MKFTFKELPHQKAATESIIGVFDGMSFVGRAQYVVDPGKDKNAGQARFDGFDLGTANAHINFNDENLQKTFLENIRKVQKRNGIAQAKKLEKQLGVMGLSIEMETGTGKTYVYIDSIFRLNKAYGFTKFVLVVPSVAIQEGVKQSFDDMREHFEGKYAKTITPILFDSNRLNQLGQFSASQGIEVIVINTAQFNKNNNVIYKSDDTRFGARVPINFIAKNRPILILDEPQKMGIENESTEERAKGKKGDSLGIQAGLKRFNPLFVMNFSATHRADAQHNMIYVLDPLDAYREKLVKRIEVVSLELENITGTSAYIHFKKYDAKTGKVSIEMEVNQKGGSVARTTMKIEKLDDLYEKSAGKSGRALEPYRGFVISDINPIVEDKKVVNAVINFSNGVKMDQGQIINNQAEDGIRRAQIRETIKAHLLREKSNFNNGIKTLSLFFIKRIAQYRQYGINGEEVAGVFQKIFSEEYERLIDEELEQQDTKGTAYATYLKNMQGKRVHNGYFCESGKGKEVDVEVDERGEATKKENEELIKRAYDLILTKKKELLSLKEPLRFLFSVTALREGWDNPNVFQICTLTESDNDIKRRQEVGRGMRLCVNENGVRMDALELNDKIHVVNVLTVIPSESYDDFVKGLQNEIRAELHRKPMTVKEEYFVGRELTNASGSKLMIDKSLADDIVTYLKWNKYIDNNGKILEKYETAKESGALAEILNSDELQPFATSIHTLVSEVVDDKEMDKYIGKAKGKEETITIRVNKKNLEKEEFKQLWNRIKQRFTYRVKFDSQKLIEQAVANINDQSNGLKDVRELRYVISRGIQDEEMSETMLEKQTAFKARTIDNDKVDVGQVQAYYDILGEIEKGTQLTRKTIANILKGIGERGLKLFKKNPEDYLKQIIEFINIAKLEFEVAAISYFKVESGNEADDIFSDKMFETQSIVASKDRIVPTSERHVMNYVFTDSSTVEAPFVKELDMHNEVSVYAKLPTGKNGYQIPTPLGNYTPDWAIAFEKGPVRHIYFVAETKGRGKLRDDEQKKIDCAKSLFKNIVEGDLKYEKITSIRDLFDKAGVAK
ncbi:MAG: DEAD/DEAH box helicase family protein [Christensenellaceae bacterium]|jgi:type III restriction enzyme|nr:DEAD/DEAH box helicase family protein [Christensenellaceae bacterium]